MVLVFNAASGNRTALPMFQEHTWRHYTYLRDSIPNMVPDLKVGSFRGSVLVFNTASENRTNLPMFQDYTWRHYTYFRDSIPNMMPDEDREFLEGVC